MKLGKDHRVKPSTCLNCGTLLGAATAVLESGALDDTANPGDFTICIECGHLMIFGEDLSLRELTDEQVRRIAGDGRLIAIQRARARMKK